MKLKKEIVILDPMLDQSVAIAKYLKKQGQYKVIGCSNNNIKGCLSKFATYKYFDEIIDYDINKALFDRYSVIIPSGAFSTQLYFNFTETCKVGEINFCKNNLIVSDKSYMLNLCKELNIPFPKTYNSDEKTVQFPVFCKSSYEVSNLKKIRIVARNQTDIDNLPHNEIIIQEYIKGSSTFGVGFIAKNGKILTSFVHEELISYPIKGGSGVFLKQIENKLLLEYTSKLLQALNYTGWGLAEFKHIPDRDEYVFMEINAKFWASLEFTLLSNSDFGRLLFGLDYASKPTKYFTFINRLLVTYSWRVFRYLPEIIVSYKSKSGSWQKMIVEFLNHWGKEL